MPLSMRLQTAQATALYQSVPPSMTTRSGSSARRTRDDQHLEVHVRLVAPEAVAAVLGDHEFGLIKLLVSLSQAGDHDSELGRRAEAERRLAPCGFGLSVSKGLHSEGSVVLMLGPGLQFTA